MLSRISSHRAFSRRDTDTLPTFNDLLAVAGVVVVVLLLVVL